MPYDFINIYIKISQNVSANLRLDRSEWETRRENVGSLSGRSESISFSMHRISHFTVSQLNFTASQLNFDESQLNLTVSQLNLTVSQLNLTVSQLNLTVSQLNLTVSQLNSTVSPNDTRGSTGMSRVIFSSIYAL